MRLDPTTLPPTVTRLPLACFGKISSDTPVITAGYSNPVRIVKINVKRNPGPSSFNMSYSFILAGSSPRRLPTLLREMQRHEHLVDQPNAGKRHNDPAKTIDQQVAREHLAGADRLVLHAAEGQWNQGYNDYRIENDCREYRALGRVQPHDVQLVQLGIYRRKHCGNDGEIFRHVIGNRKGSQRTTSNEQLLTDGHNFDQLRRIAVEIDHVTRFFCCH